MKNLSFFRIFLRSKKTKFFIEKCMKNGKIEIEKKRSQNFRWTDFHFDIALLPINGFGRNFVQNYTYFHCGGDGAGENPPFEALRCALRIRMSSIPPTSYIVTFQANPTFKGCLCKSTTLRHGYCGSNLQWDPRLLRLLLRLVDTFCYKGIL